MPYDLRYVVVLSDFLFCEASLDSEDTSARYLGLKLDPSLLMAQFWSLLQSVLTTRWEGLYLGPEPGAMGPYSVLFFVHSISCTV